MGSSPRSPSGGSPAGSSPPTRPGDARRGSSRAISTRPSRSPSSSPLRPPEILSAYGFLAAFAAGLGFRRDDPDHEHNERVHAGAEAAEKLSELALVLIVGLALTQGGLGVPGREGWLLVAVLLLVIRPVAVALAFVRAPVSRRERVFVGWFGVRGIGSIYYVTFVVAEGYLPAEEARVLLWTTIAVTAVSIVVHGVSATPLARRLLPDAPVDPPGPR